MGSNDIDNDFVVDTRGYCFLCLNQTKLISSISECDQNQNKQPDSFQSIQYLSKYLKLDMSKVFKGPVPPDLLAKVERSRLKVELCSECSSLNDKLSELLSLLEKTKIDITFRLSFISDIIQSSNRTDRFHQITTNIKTANLVSDLNLQVIGKLEIAQVLREEAGLKCAKKLLSFPFPKASLEKVDIKEIKKKTQTSNDLKTKENVRIDDIDMKVEISSSLSSNELDEEFEKTDNFDDSFYLDNKTEDSSRECSSTENTNSSICGTLKTETDRGMKILRTEKSVKKLGTVPPPIKSVTGRREKPGSISSKSRINPINGKHQCRICSKEYAAYSCFYMHFKSAHMNVSYTCPAPNCGKVCTKNLIMKNITKAFT